ncbi:MAG: sugar ABC transporter permease [Candidatus Pristimantibacillus lignocellulolyticus]|uniref:Sugar ABC transporter permease n=1 Tax=Candidatus Pristimantibacillus lignocellulolyticus TaxID=2994561 RepID=A0A9J6ZL53_9BACL|nr:MAG: sugar ABC transporter permease [Candidatus Pristimantibacillus lignocellulolyticus]
MKQRTYLQQKALWGIIFAFPWIIGFIFFFLVPMVDSLRYSFSSVVSSSEGLNINFIGFDNFINALTVNASFNRSLVEAIVNMLVNVPLIVIFSLFVAVLLNQKFLGRAFARSIFFLPVILASGIILSLESSSLIQAVNDENIGSGFASAMGVFELERIMLRAGVSEVIVEYLTGAVDRIYQIVSQSGVQILIFLAAIQTIPPQLYEASTMEGATGYESFWKITFPMVSPLIFVNMIYTIIDSFSVNALTDLIRQTGFTSFNFGLSSAMAWIYFLAIAIILATSSYIVSKRVFYYD